MARKKNTAKLLNPVRWLTIKEIAALWANEIAIPDSIIQRELQLAAINLPRLESREGMIPEFPESTLPPAETIMDRNFLWKFCKKQSPWGYPRFWFDEWAPPSYPGRSSVMHAILQHFNNLSEANQLESTLREQAMVLAEWAKSALPPAQTRVQLPTPRTIENAIRREFRDARAARAPSNRSPQNYR